MKKKAILFDLDDTLLDFHRSEDVALRKTLSENGVTPTDEMIKHYSKVNLSQWKLLEKGELTREQVLYRRFEIFFSDLGLTCDPVKVQSGYENALSQSYFYLDGAEELLDELSQKYRLFVVSNGTAKVQDGRIALSGIGKYFEQIFISQRAGYDKPNPKFFDKCFELIGDLDRSDCFIVGDSLTSDIQGGKNSGITTVWYNLRNYPRDPEIVPDYEIPSLDMLPIVAEMIFEEETEE